MVDANRYLYNLKTTEFAQENANNFVREVMSAAKTANPDMVKAGRIYGYNYNTTQADIEKIDQILASQSEDQKARVAFHTLIGNGDQITSDPEGKPIFPAIAAQNVAAFNKVLEASNGTGNSFADAVPIAQPQDPTMQPASLTEPAAPQSLSDRLFKPLQKEHQENENRRIEEQIRKAGGGVAPQASMQGCDFNPADLSTLSPSCPKGPGGARELS